MAKIKLLSQTLPVNKSPIIILGNQKTGTSAIAHLLADYGGLSKTVDIPEIVSPNIEKIINAEVPLKAFARKYRYRFSRDVIKEPGLTFLYDQLQRLHPDAKYIFITRDPRSNIRSILNRLSLPGNLDRLDDGYAVHPLWKNIFDTDLWNIPDGNYIETLAHRWVKAAKVYQENKEKMILIKYEDFNEDKLNIIVDLANILGIDKKNDISNKLDVQYQQKGKPNVKWEDFFGIDNLKRIEQICADYMDLFDYEIINK